MDSLSKEMSLGEERRQTRDIRGETPVLTSCGPLWKPIYGALLITVPSGIAAWPGMLQQLALLPWDIPRSGLAYSCHWKVHHQQRTHPTWSLLLPQKASLPAGVPEPGVGSTLSEGQLHLNDGIAVLAQGPGVKPKSSWTLTVDSYRYGLWGHRDLDSNLVSAIKPAGHLPLGESVSSLVKWASS